MSKEDCMDPNIKNIEFVSKGLREIERTDKYFIINRG